MDKFSALRISPLALLVIVASHLCDCVKVYTEEELTDKYAKILDEWDEQLASGFRNMFKPKRVDRLKNDYQKLNAQLVKLLPHSEDPNENLRLASELLRSELGGTIKSGSSNEDNLKEALEYFVALGELNEDEKCNGRSETILRLNDYLTDGRARSDDRQVGQLRSRLDNIVRHFAHQHERQCRDVYAQKFKLKLNEMDQAGREKLYALLSDSKLANIAQENPELLIELMLISSNRRLARKFKTTNQQLANYIADSLFVQSDVDEFYQVNGAFDKLKFDLVYDKYVTRPCQSYLRVLGSEVFEPAIFDLGTSNERLRQQSMSDDEIRFVFALGRFAICESVLSQGDSFSKLVAKESRNKYKELHV